MDRRISQTRKVIAVEMQGHGRTADIDRDFSYENLADDVAALLDHLKIPSADLIGYRAAAASRCSVRSAIREGRMLSAFQPGSARMASSAKGSTRSRTSTPEAFKGSPIEIEYKKPSPTPDKFADLVNHIKAMASRPFDFADSSATKAPMFFIHGDADGVRSNTSRKCSA